jgi:uncharacterized membrane protein
MDCEVWLPPSSAPRTISEVQMSPEGDVARASRLPSLDAFRGLVIAAMIVVNNPGSESAIYAPLRHAHWHGCTLADLIFPAFPFITGVALDGAGRAHRAAPLLAFGTNPIVV